MNFLQSVLWLISMGVNLSVEPQLYSPASVSTFPDTTSVQYYDGQSFWPCIVHKEGTLCQKDSNDVIIYVPN